jgi:hypothetical protein
MKANLRRQEQYARLEKQLGQIGYISQGSVFQRQPGQQGSRYVWTRKVKAKTITVALSPEQYQWMRQAVANQRKLNKITQQMQKLSRQILFASFPDIERRKPLDNNVLGLI